MDLNRQYLHARCHLARQGCKGILGGLSLVQVDQPQPEFGRQRRKKLIFGDQSHLDEQRADLFLLALFLGFQGMFHLLACDQPGGDQNIAYTHIFGDLALAVGAGDFLVDFLVIKLIFFCQDVSDTAFAQLFLLRQGQLHVRRSDCAGVLENPPQWLFPPAFPDAVKCEEDALERAFDTGRQAVKTQGIFGASHDLHVEFFAADQLKLFPPEVAIDAGG